MDIISLNEAKKAMRKVEEMESWLYRFAKQVMESQIDFQQDFQERVGNFHYHVGNNEPASPVNGMWWFDTSTGFPKYYHEESQKWINPHAYL